MNQILAQDKNPSVTHCNFIPLCYSNDSLETRREIVPLHPF